MAMGRGVYSGCQWLLLVIIARLATPEELGKFTYALAVTSPIIMFAQLNMRAYMASDSIAHFRFEDYLITRFITVLVAILIVGFVVISSDLTSSAAMILMLVGLYKAAEAISDIYYGALQQQEVMQSIGVSVMMHGISAVLIMSLSLVFFGNVVIGVAGVCGAWVLILLSYDMPEAKKRLAKTSEAFSARIWQVVKACFPLGLILAMLSLRVNLPIYFIKSELGTDQVGYYSAVGYFIVAGRILTGSLVQAAVPRMAKHYNQKEFGEYNRLFKKLLGISIFVGLAGIIVSWALGYQILWLFYGISYARYADLLVWVMIAAAIGYISQFFGAGLTVARLFRYQIFSNAIGVIIIVILSYTLIPVYGLTGGAIALLGGALSTLLFNIMAVFTKMNLKGTASPL